MILIEIAAAILGLIAVCAFASRRARVHDCTILVPLNLKELLRKER